METAALVLGPLSLVVLVVLAGVSAETGRAGAVALVAASVAWLLCNGRMEGPVLLRVTWQHGLTGADLAGLAGLALGAWRWRRSARAARGPVE
jgi:hypothetical protein